MQYSNNSKNEKFTIPDEIKSPDSIKNIQNLNLQSIKNNISNVNNAMNSMNGPRYMLIENEMRLNNITNKTKNIMEKLKSYYTKNSNGSLDNISQIRNIDDLKFY
jgi:hypothetical protein